MNNIFSSAFESMTDSLFRCAAVPVTYTRRDGTTVLCHAVQGFSKTCVPSADGIFLEASSHDFLFRRSDIPFTPQRGDTVTTAYHTYEVAALGNSSHWRYSTPFVIRIHCK